MPHVAEFARMGHRPGVVPWPVFRKGKVGVALLQTFEDPILPGTLGYEQGGLSSAHDGSPRSPEIERLFDFIYRSRHRNWHRNGHGSRD